MILKAESEIEDAAVRLGSSGYRFPERLVVTQKWGTRCDSDFISREGGGESGGGWVYVPPRSEKK